MDEERIRAIVNDQIRRLFSEEESLPVQFAECAGRDDVESDEDVREI
jgi:hypothetical protein